MTRFKAKGGFGVDIEAPLVADANDRARRDGVADKVKFHVRDLFDTKVGEGTRFRLEFPCNCPDSPALADGAA